jgi:hypothetical protein
MAWFDILNNKIRVGCFVAIVLLRVQFILIARNNSPSSSLWLKKSNGQFLSTEPCTDSNKQEPFPYYNPIPMTATDTWANVSARAFTSWPYAFPCFPAIKTWFTDQAQYTAIDRGLVFLSPFKTGSTTSVGVHLRMAKRQARRRNLTMCRVRYRHKYACRMYDEDNLVPEELFTWTVLRDPTTRVVSQFFYYLSEESYDEPTDDNFQAYLATGMERGFLVRNHYVGQLSRTCMREIDPVTYTPYAQAFFRDINFVGITERMDESIVALSMILNVSLADVLYLKNNKAAGDFSRHARRPKCNYILPSFVTPRMKEYFQSDAWQASVYWDHLVYTVANRSLDLTIDALGRETFARKLKRFQQAKQRAQGYCLPRVTLPCGPSGNFTGQKKTDCLFLDAGCGYDCLDEVSEQLRLDEDI